MALGSLPLEILSEVARLLCLDDSLRTSTVMGYRLINRVFNREILHHCFVTGCRYPGTVCESNPAAVAHNALTTRRMLQGCLSAVAADPEGNSDWKDSLRKTLAMLKTRKSYLVLPSKSACLKSPLSTTGSTALNGIFDDKASIVLCDAVVSFHSRAYVHEAFVSVHRRKKRKFLSEVDFWLLLIPCFTGDLEEVRLAYRRLQQQTISSGSTDLQLVTKITRCLHVAAREGHEAIVRYLLDIGADPEADVPVRPWPAWPCSALEASLMAAADNGHVHILEMLLPLCQVHEASRIKGNILYIACKFNIVPVAQFVLATGSVRVYGRGSPKAFGSPLIIAVEHGHTACVQLLLHSQPRFSTGTGGEKLVFLQLGAGSIRRANNLDMLRKMVAHLDKVAALLCGSAVEGGVQAAIQIKGPYDLEEEYKHQHNSHEHRLGAEALQRSVEWGRVENVRYLLGLGVTITRGACIGCSLRREQVSPSLYDVIPQLFAEASHHAPVRVDKHWLFLT